MRRITVVIPICNVEKYVERCLCSVMTQTYKGAIECILIDDGSSDGSFSVVEKMLSGYEGPIRFQILHNVVKSGPSYSRNIGLQQATGEYLFFLDSDDQITPDCLECLEQELDKYGQQIDMVVGNAFNCRIKSNWMDSNFKPYLLDNHEEIVRKHLDFVAPIVAWNKLIRRQFLLDSEISFPVGLLHEDEFWALDLYDRVHSVVFIPQVTYIYEYNSGSIMNSDEVMDLRVFSCNKYIQVLMGRLRTGMYVEKSFYLINTLMKLNDYVNSNRVGEENRAETKHLNRKFLFRTMADGRFIIASFSFFTLLPPFCFLARFAWFRRKYTAFEQIAKKTALSMNFVHNLGKLNALRSLLSVSS